MPFGEHGAALTRTVTSLCSAGILERAAHGVYVYSYSGASRRGAHWTRSCGACGRAVSAGRVWRGALSQYGVISQIPMGRVTYMTTGRSGSSPLGSASSRTHSKLPVSRILPGLVSAAACHIGCSHTAISRMWAATCTWSTREELYWDEDE